MISNKCIRNGCPHIKHPAGDYCCRSCSQNNGHGSGCSSSSNKQSSSNSASGQTCNRPGCNKSRYPGFDYCGKSCGQLHNQSSSNSNSTQSCIRPGCNRSRYPGFDYCGRSCALGQKPISQSNCASCLSSGCNHKPNPGYDHCCLSCKNGHGHGPRCTSVAIFFYDKSDPFYEFTNFYLCQILIDNISYKSTEHYFQSQKFARDHPQIADQVAKQSSPKDAFREAQKYSHLIRSDWHTGFKDQVMMTALKAKFWQVEHLKKLLISTGSKFLIENSPVDSEWGIGADGKGKNKLGLMLMQVRTLLQKNSF